MNPKKTYRKSRNNLLNVSQLNIATLLSLVILLILIIPGIFFLSWYRLTFFKNLDNDFLDRVKFVSEHFRMEFENEFYSNPNFSEKKVIEFLNNNSNVLYIQVYNWNQKLIYSSTNKPLFNIRDLYSHADTQKLEDSIYVKRFIVKNNLEILNSFIVFNLSALNEKKELITNDLLFRSFFSLIAMFIFVYLISKFVEKPLIILKKDTEEISKGYLEIKINENIGTFEINEIAKNINIITEGLNFSQNALIDELRTSSNSISIQNEELKQAKENAERANRLKSEFIANVSHEIRTPMNSIIGLTEILKSKSTNDEDKSYLEGILKSGRTLLNFINEILDISKIEAGKMKIEKEPLNLKNLAIEIKDIFNFTIQQKGINFIFIYDERLPKSILSDEIRIKQILINLLNNATKFTEIGQISLIFEEIKEDLFSGTVDFKITVKDTGIGINLKDGRNIFEPFVQKEGQDSKKFGGSGLGLAITKQIVEMMNGTINVKSEIQNGTEFEVILRDVVIDFSNKEINFNDLSLISSLPSANILLVESNELNRRLIIEMFKPSLLKFIEADTGELAVEIAKSQKIDLIILDTHISNPNCFETIEILKSLSLVNEIPVIATTTNAMKSERERLLNFGFENVILKPIDNIQLINTFKTYLKTESFNKTQKLISEIKTDNYQTSDFSENEMNFTDKMEFILRFSKKASEIAENLILSEAKLFCEELKDFNKKQQSILISHFIEELNDGIEKFKLEKVKSILKKIESMEQRSD